VPGIFRNPMAVIFVDLDQRELGRIDDARIVPRVGENVRLRDVPYRVERVGYDVMEREFVSVFVVLVAT